MPRRQFFERAATAGIAAFTGPTFSVSAESAAIPAAQNVAMLLRHHRIVAELVQARLGAIPNLYWRTSRDLDRWKNWLRRENNVTTISRDFSRTKPRSDAFHRELSGLRSIVEGAARQLHVVLVGLGPGKARIAMEHLAAVGATCSVVSAAPIMAAIKRGRAYQHGEGRVVKIGSTHQPREALALANLTIMREHLIEIASQLAPYANRIDRTDKIDVA
jgi:hypothetical protein